MNSPNTENARYKTASVPGMRKFLAIQDSDQGSVKSFLLRGRWFYCRKCVKDETVGGIAIPEASTEDTNCVTILAIGEKCGETQKLTKQEKNLKDMCAGMSIDGIGIGDTLMCPEDHPWGIMRSPWVPFEYFIHECVPFCKFDKDCA